jgi:hypothetical protein
MEAQTCGIVHPPLSSIDRGLTSRNSWKIASPADTVTKSCYLVLLHFASELALFLIKKFN